MSLPRTNGLTRFDRLATAVSNTVAKAWFFSLCAALVLLWVPSYFLFGSVDTWQLVINTMTTIVTFLLVALLQNTQYRSNEALHKKLNALTEALADLMESHERTDPTMRSDVEDLREANGMETREGT